MEKKNRKQIISLVLAFICCFVLMLGTEPVHASVLKPEQVTGVSLERTSGTAVELNWDAVSEAKGYAIYMKTNKGKYKLIKTTKATKLSKSGLVIGNSYYFKVRAYKNVNGKKIYGPVSEAIKKKMLNYEYLPDVMDWYSSDNNIQSYTDVESISLFDEKHYHGLTPKDRHNGSSSFSGTVYYNLKGKYSRVEFSYCSFYEGNEGEAMFFKDEELAETCVTSPNMLPKMKSIDVEDTHIFKIYLENCALLDVKLYY